jgi:hypothetical protein
MADPKTRVLRKVWGGLGLTWDGDSASSPVMLGNESSWIGHSFTPPGVILPSCLIYRSDYFDLSGYTLEDETVYPQGIRINDLEFLSGVSTGTGVVIKRLDLVCTKRPTLADLTNLSQFEGWMTPGASTSRYGLEEIVGGRLSRYVQTADTGGFQQTAITSWGTCSATAGEKLYIVQAYLISNAVSSLLIPGSSLVLPSMIGTEPELEYMMRLSRSYELQGAV